MLVCLASPLLLVREQPRRVASESKKEKEISSDLPFPAPSSSLALQHIHAIMGKAAKMYKRPSLKQKQARRNAAPGVHDKDDPRQKTTSSSASASKAASLEELKRQAREQKILIEQEKRREQRQQQEQEGDHDESADVAKKRSGRAKKRYKVPEGEARTPKEAGIDYVAQFEGKKHYKA